MPAEVIDRVHLLARRQKANPGLVFLDRERQPFDDEEPEAGDESKDDDDDYVPDDGDDYDDEAYNSDDDGDDDDYDGDDPPHDDNEIPGEHKGVNESNEGSDEESSDNYSSGEESSGVTIYSKQQRSLYQTLSIVDDAGTNLCLFSLSMHIMRILQEQPPLIQHPSSII